MLTTILLNQLMKFSATDVGDFSDTQFSRIFFQDFSGGVGTLYFAQQPTHQY